jgi:hypothetical protein
MKRTYLVLFGFASALAIAAGCQATSNRSQFDDDSSGGDDDGSGGAGSGQGGHTSASSSGDGVGGGFIPGDGSSGTSGGPTCVTDPNTDDDGDGLSEAQGDCNDCDKNVSPGSIEVVNLDPMAQAADENCDGQVDNVLPAGCDDNIALEDADANNGARAVDLCQFTTPDDPKWGVLAAQYVRANGAATGYSSSIGIMSDFGPNVNVQGGTRMLAISSGRSRLPSQPGACGSLTCNTTGKGTPPAGFPQDVPNCSGSKSINDDIGLEVKVRAPKNATGYKFNFKFYSFEYPEWVCTSYNDQFIALVNPPPMGSINGNISFDKNKNPVSVNIAFFDVCDPDPQHPCPLGPGEMVGTGFNQWNNAGGTSWLATQAPINGGEEFSIRFAIWDTGDQAYDSTALIDGFQWIANGGTVQVGTEPIPDPK